MHQTSRKAVSLALALSMALGMTPAMAADGEQTIQIGVHGTKRAGFGETIEQYVSLGSAQRVNTVQVEFDVDPALVSMRSAEALEGFMVIGGVKWTTNADGSAHASLTLGMGGPEGLTVSEMTDILKLAFTDKGVEGRSGLTLTSVKAAALDEQNNAYFADTQLTEEETSTQIKWSRYDLNEDGKVDMLDVASALRYYQMSQTDAGWDGVEYCDVSLDGVIDMSDLTLIMAHYNTSKLPDASGFQEVRQTININDGWKFHYGNTDGSSVSFDDSGWESLNLPHTWNADDADSGNYKRGTGWYRKTMTFDSATYGGQELYIDFGAACLKADVYVNGEHVGQHKGGFASFRYDITPYVKLDEETVIAVKVNNQNDLEIPPLDSGNYDFSLQGGIYRDVSIIATQSVHIDTMNYASSGVFLTPMNVSGEKADLNVRADVVNRSNADRSVEVRAELVDAEDELVASMTDTFTVPANGSHPFDQTVTVENPHLWDGVKDPYLYHVNVQVLDADSGEALDGVAQNTGFRSYSVDKEDGFFLNGNYVNLHGVNYHQDHINGGWSAGRDIREADYTVFIKEMGANAVRMAHYQHDDWDYDVTDELGFAVWTEIPLVKQYTKTADGNAIDPAFLANARQQLTEMILQLYNHPSCMFWGMSNEMPDYTTNSAGEYLPEILMDNLSSLAHELDPNRLTTLASDQSQDLYFQVGTDLKAINHYSGWYLPDVYEYTDYYNGRYNASTSPVGLSEYGAGANPTQHMDNPTNVDVLPADSGWHPVEYQAAVHEADWAQFKDRPEIWAKFIWTGFDFASYKKDEGGVIGINDKGMVSRDRQYRKDAYYFYQSAWSEEPMVRIASHGFDQRPHNIPTLKVYSNCDTVTLFVNGKAVSTIERDSLKDQPNDTVFVWNDVELGLTSASEVKAVAVKDGKTYEDAVVWTGIPGDDTRVTSQKYLVLEAAADNAAGKPGAPENASRLETPAEGVSFTDYLKDCHVPYGAQVKCVLSDGTEVPASTAVESGMKLLVTSEDGSSTRTYVFFTRSLALGKNVSANSVKGSQSPTMVTDGTSDVTGANGMWAPIRNADSKYTFPSHVIIDLGDVYDFSEIDLYPLQGHSTGYAIYVGEELNGEWAYIDPDLDLKDGVKVAGNDAPAKLSSDDLSEHYTETFAEPVRGRYVKVVLLNLDGSNADTKTQYGIRELEIYGCRLVSEYPVDTASQSIQIPAGTTVAAAQAAVRVEGNHKGVRFTAADGAVLANDAVLTSGCKLAITDYAGNTVVYTIFVKGDQVPVQSVTLDASELEVSLGDKVRLNAAVAPAFASNKKVTWSTSDSAVAVVSEDGVVTGLAEGAAVITVTTEDGGHTASCQVTVTPVTAADAGSFLLLQSQATAGTTRDLELNLSINREHKTPSDWQHFDANTAGIRNTTVTLTFPAEIPVTYEDEISIIGQPKIKLGDKAGFAAIKENGSDVVGVSKNPPAAVISDNGRTLTITGLDLMPNNGVDIQLFLKNKAIPAAGEYRFGGAYQPKGENKVAGDDFVLTSVNAVSDLTRVLDKSLTYKETADTYTSVELTWTKAEGASSVVVEQSLDEGLTWTAAEASAADGSVKLTGLEPNRLYAFRLNVTGGKNAGVSNAVQFYSGKIDVKAFGGAKGDGVVNDPTCPADDTAAIQKCVDFAAEIGGGTVYFPAGNYLTGTIHLRSNVYLYLDTDATILAKHGKMDPPEPYYLASPYIVYEEGNSKSGPWGGNNNAQDIGHSFFTDALFVGKRIDNFKVLGTGVIDGNGALTTQDANKANSAKIDVTPNSLGETGSGQDNLWSENWPDIAPFGKDFTLGDKMFSLHLCTNFELGGDPEMPFVPRFPDDLIDDGPAINPETGRYYDEGDQNSRYGDYAPYAQYDPTKNADPAAMPQALKFRRAGHFVVLATGTDNMNMHSLYYLNGTAPNAEGIQSALAYGDRQRDMFDIMGCDNVTVDTVYAALLSDDFVKMGSEFSMGFRKPTSNINVSNIVGRSECNLFKIGSETAADTFNVNVSNAYGYHIYKAGININENDGANIYDINVDSVTLYHTSVPITINLGARNRNGQNSALAGGRTVGTIHDISVKNVKSFGQDYKGLVGTHANELGPVVVIGHSGSGNVHDIDLENIEVFQRGGLGENTSNDKNPSTGTVADKDLIPQYDLGKNYDAGGYFQKTGSPVYGLIVKYATNVKVTNLITRFINEDEAHPSLNYHHNDDRYAVYVDDSKNVFLDGATLQKGQDPYSGCIAVMNTNGFGFRNVNYFQMLPESEEEGAALIKTVTELPDQPSVIISNSQKDRMEYPEPPPFVGDVSSAEVAANPKGAPHLADLDAGISAVDQENHTITALVGLTAEDLFNELDAADHGSTQTYAMQDGKTGMLAAGDVLIVTSEDGTATQEYTLVIQTTIQGEGNNSPEHQFLGVSAYVNPEGGGKFDSSSDKNELMGFGAFGQITKSSTGVGNYMEYTLQNIPAGRYQIELTSKMKPDRGQMALFVDGKDTGLTVDETTQDGENKVDGTVYATLPMGTLTLGEGKTHTFRFVITGRGKFAKPTGTAGFDCNIGYFRLTPIGE